MFLFRSKEVNIMKLEVVNYNPNWLKEFDSEKLLLADKLGNLFDNIHHIGSTAVEGLAAKPIIDIILEAKSLEALDKAEPEFKSLGYEAKGEFGISGRRYFRKGGDNPTHHIHAFKTGDKNVHRHIAFRDYLNAHPKVKLEYRNLKLELIQTCNNEIDCYCDGKDKFIKYYEAKALEWVSST